MSDLQMPPFAAPEWPASSIEMRDPAKLKPNPKNPRKHSPEQIEMIRASIDEFGWTVPCVIDETGKIWGGHGRVMAALLDPPIERVPCAVARGWSNAQKVAYMLADNRIGELSAWDHDVARDNLNDIKDVFDLAIAGFDAIALPNFLLERQVGENDPREAWQGMPEFDQQDKTSFKSVVVHFKDQAAVDKFADLTKHQITPKTRSIWYPEIEIERYADKQYKAQE